ncbi:hypothetical protein [Myroides odoratus]|uniref:hypothetical protein n=1 Tax=Myroides odoratus TaxID=256 RepID=UPI0033414E0A
MKYLIDLQEYLLYNLQQIGVSIKLSGMMSVVVLMVVSIWDKLDKWLDESIDYVLIALFLVAADHFLGTVYHLFFKRDFSWMKNIVGLLIKLTMVLVGGLIFESLTHITKEQDLVYGYLKMTTRLIVCLYPGSSGLKNVNNITKGVFPGKALVGVFEGFKKDLNLDKLKKGKENEGD